MKIGAADRIVIVLITAAAALACTNGCRHPDRTAAVSPSLEDCTTVAALGLPDDATLPEPLQPGVPWLVGALDPSMPRRNLGLAAAAERIAGEPKVREALDEFHRASDPAIAAAVEAPERIAAIASARSVYAKALAQGGELLVLPNAEAPGPLLGTVALWKCGRNLPLYSHLTKQVEGFTASPDRRWLAVVHAGKRNYGGAVVPLYLKNVELVLVNMETLEARHLPFPDDLSVQSISLAWESSSQLRLRLRNTWDDERGYARCDLTKPPCDLPPLEKRAADPSFPRSNFLEVTSRSAYRVSLPPSGFDAPKRLVPRSVQTSADGKWVAYLTADDDANSLFPTTIHLWVRGLSPQARPVELQEGEELFHFAWREDGTLVFEGPITPMPELASRLEAAPADPSLQEQAKFIAGAEGEPSPKEIARTERMLATRAAIRMAAAEGQSSEQMWSMRLHRYDPLTQKRLPGHPGSIARLWSGADGPSHHHKVPVREVPLEH